MEPDGYKKKECSEVYILLIKKKKKLIKLVISSLPASATALLRAALHQSW